MKLEQIILDLYELEEKDLTIENLKYIKREFSKNNSLKNIPTNIQLINTYNQMVEKGVINKNHQIETVIKKRSIRSMSGIVPIQVLMKPYLCKGRCIFCPNDASMPKSYINSEPGAMRALLNDFDPIKQVYNRLLSLQLTGHNTDKIEMIVLGGSFDYYPLDYKIGFIKGLYDACNSFQNYKKNISVDIDNKIAKITDYDKDKISFPNSIQESISINENAINKIIGLTIETKPELINDENCMFWRSIGVTRVEMGIQSLFDSVLLANNRDSTVKQIELGMHKLRSYGFKISTHFMPGLYKSNIEMDIETIKIAFENIYLRPDEIKYYPTSVIPNTILYSLYQKGSYIPLGNDQIDYIIQQIKLKYIPPYTRIKRLIRDIPANEIVAGSNITNLRQLVLNKMKLLFETNLNIRLSQYDRLFMSDKTFEDVDCLVKYITDFKMNDKDFETLIVGDIVDKSTVRNFQCLCTRCREIRNSGNKIILNELLVIRRYNLSNGQEFFISIEDDKGYLGGFLRLLLPVDGGIANIKGLGNLTAIVRELHVYGEVAKINHQENNKIQHKGLGTKLMNIAQTLTKALGYKKLSVISGIGVRNYYNKLGFELEGTYMTKKLN